MDCKDNPVVLDSAKQLRLLRGRYAGKACAVIGNGPSLRAGDLELLRGACTFGVNKIYDLYSATDWRPTFYAIQDFKLMKAIFGELEPATRKSEYRFFNARILDEPGFCTLSRSGDFYFSLYNEWEKDGQIRHPSFSEDCSERVYEGYTVTYSILQLAAFLGFGEIYLLGVDHSYSSKGVGGRLAGTHEADYFPGHRPLENVTLNAPRLDRSTAAYEAAKTYGDIHGIRILNATRGGYLEVFPRVPFACMLEALLL